MIVRSDGEIRYFRISPRTQAALVAGATAGSLWLLAASVATAVQNASLSDRTVQLVETMRANMDLRQRAVALNEDLSHLKVQLARYRQNLEIATTDGAERLRAWTDLQDRVATLEGKLARAQASTAGMRARIGTLTKELELAHYRFDDLAAKHRLMGYDLSRVRSGEETVPRVFPAALPAELKHVKEPEARKENFIRFLLPIVLELNAQMLEKRARLVEIQHKFESGTLAPSEESWLKDLAAQFAVDLEHEEAIPLLVRRVDAVPPSLALAQAAEESGWGTSRFARDGNAVFGQRTWQAGAGMVPAERAAHETYEVKRFERLADSVADYIRNLNTHPAYVEFRKRRASMRETDGQFDALELARDLTRYSERGADYVRQIQRIMRDNLLWEFDEAQLETVLATSDRST